MDAFFISVAVGIVLEVFGLHYQFLVILFVISLFQRPVKGSFFILLLASFPQAVRMINNAGESGDVLGFKELILSGDSLAFYDKSFQIGTTWFFSILRYFDLGIFLSLIVVALILSLSSILFLVIEYDLWECFIMLSCIDSLFSVHVFRQSIPSLILLIGIFSYVMSIVAFQRTTNNSSFPFRLSKSALITSIPLIALSLLSHNYMILSAIILILTLLLSSFFVSLAFIASLLGYLSGFFSQPAIYINLLLSLQSIGLGQVSGAIMALDLDTGIYLSPLALLSYCIMAFFLLARHRFVKFLSFDVKLFAGNAAFTMPLIGIPIIGPRFAIISSCFLVGIPFLMLRDLLRSFWKYYAVSGSASIWSITRTEM